MGTSTCRSSRASASRENPTSYASCASWRRSEREPGQMTPVKDRPVTERTAYAVDALRDFAAELFRRAGLDGDKPEVSAEVLVEADLMGHTTHGLALLPRYLQEIG